MIYSPTAPPGLDLVRLGDWFNEHVLCVAGPLHATVIAGGRSNLTYLVSDGVHDWIVRRPPLGHVMATAHDMAREYRVMTALRETHVPVPDMYGFCSDLSVLGVPFYVMEHVSGTAFRRAEELAALGPDRTLTISERLVDALVVLHMVDPTEVGLEGFGRPDGYLTRQLIRWKQQLEDSYTRELPAAHELFARLADDVPHESTAGIVHGDYRLDNVMVDDDDRLIAVLDWEMATLGDPLADLALTLTYQRLGNTTHGNAVSDASAAPGFIGERAFAERYGVGSGRDLSGFGFYLGLASFKLAAILESIHRRYLDGHTVGDGFENVAGAVEPVLVAGLDALRDWK
jgi:aminoglycoside phosphotransferase (APT) family kinase protein